MFKNIIALRQFASSFLIGKAISFANYIIEEGISNVGARIINGNNATIAQQIEILKTEVCSGSNKK